MKATFVPHLATITFFSFTEDNRPLHRPHVERSNLAEYIPNRIIQLFAPLNMFDIIFGLSETVMCDITTRAQ